jgi:hypothetical protein
MRLVPMLEIIVPADPHEFGGLPVKAGVTTKPALPQLTGTNIISDTERLNTWLDSWLDEAETRKYGVSVRVKDPTGALAVYVPLNLGRFRPAQSRHGQRRHPGQEGSGVRVQSPGLVGG